MSIESDLKRTARAVADAEVRLAKAKEARAIVVRVALDAGMTVREVAAIVGISHQQVHNIDKGDPSGRRTRKAR